MTKAIRKYFQLAINAVFNEETVAILGPRGVGKSFFLNKLLKELRSITNAIPILVSFNYDTKVCREIQEIIYQEFLKKLSDRTRSLSFFVKQPLKRFLKSGYAKDLYNAIKQVKKEYSISTIFVGEDIPNYNECMKTIQYFSIITSSAPVFEAFNPKTKVIRIHDFVSDLLMDYLSHKSIVVEPSAFSKLLKLTGGFLSYTQVLLPYLKYEIQKGIPVDGSLIEELVNSEHIEFWMTQLALIYDNFYRKFYGNCYNYIIDTLFNSQKRDLKAKIENLLNTSCLKSLIEIRLITKNDNSLEFNDKQIKKLYLDKKNHRPKISSINSLEMFSVTSP